MRERVLFVGKPNDLGRNITAALKSLGHECLFFNQQDGITYRYRASRKIIRTFPSLQFLRKWENERINRRLIATARSFKPTILLVWNGDSIVPETIHAIKQQGIITANWFLDLMTHWAIIKHVAPAYDYFFSPDQEVIRALDGMGVRAYQAAFGFKRAFSKFPDGPRKYPITFIGSYNAKIWRKREELLAMVKDLGVHVWGPDAWRTTRLAECYHGVATGDKMINIYEQSKIVIDIPWDHITADTVSIRPFEATSAGACLFFYDIRPEMQKFFLPNVEYVPFKTADELREKAAYYLNHPHELEAIARAGYARFMREHTYEARLRDIISEIRATA